MSPRRSSKEPRLAPESPLAPIVEQLRAMVRGLEETALPDADGDAAAFVRGKVEGIESAITLLQRAGALHVVTNEGQRLVRLERHHEDPSLVERVAQLEKQVRSLISTAPLPRAKAMPEILKESVTLTKCARELLGVLAQRRDKATSLVQLSILSGYSISSSSFDASVRALRSQHFTNGSREDIRITREGLKEAGDVAGLPPDGSPAILDYWCSKLGKTESALLRAIVESTKTGGFQSAVELSDATGYSPTSSSFDGAIRKLRKLRLIGRDWPMLAASTFRRSAS